MFIGFTALCGVTALGYGLLQTHSLHPLQFTTMLVIALASSRLKVKLPGLTSSMLVNLPFLLIATRGLSLIEALIIALTSTAVQCFPSGGWPKPVQTLFNVSTMAVAVGLAGRIFQGRMPPTASGSLLIALAAATFFLAQTIPVATIISLTEGGNALRIWSSIFQQSFPYYVVSAGVTSLVTTASHRVGWQVPLLVLAVMYGVYRSYRLYFGREEIPARPIALAKAAAAE
jgi:hypothetical protein